MKRVHYTDSYLMNPQHPVTVNIIGAGENHFIALIASRNE